MNVGRASARHEVSGIISRVTPDPKWEAFAAREPYFAVFTRPKFLRANLTAAHEREFFDSGEDLADSMFSVIRRRLAPNFAPTTVLELGCGVGRLAIPFARCAELVTAVDASPAMLEAARREAQRQSVANIDFETADRWRAARRKFDLVSCYLVFQRMPPREGLALLRELIGCIGPGGVGVFHFPYRAPAAPLLAATRWLREHAGVLNGFANVLRGKRFNDPFIATHAYDLDDVLAVFDGNGFHEMQVSFEQHEGIAGALIYVRRPLHTTTAGATQPSEAETAPESGAMKPAAPQEGGEMIDVRRLIASTSIEELNRTAEAYFAGLTEWEHHLAKPFAKPEESASILMNVATLLHGLHLKEGDEVLEFGAGTGWLSRFLTQLGCRVTLLDVSPTALEIARELYRKQPPIGERPAPRTLVFDGRRVDLPDASIDRVISFDAFHHTPNPDEVLHELARVLRPGGIAAFAEPGPRHSRTPLSQFEMRTYGVVENDVDIHAVWRTAQEAGFRELRLAVFHGPPFHLPLAEFDDFLAGGDTCARWAASTRDFIRDVRNFFLVKAGEERIDSRSSLALACEIAAPPSVTAREGERVTIDVTVTNSGAATWLPSDNPSGGVALGTHFYDRAGKLIAFDVHWQPLTEPPREVVPGETLSVRISLPPQGAGQYVAELDCVAARVTWFAQAGSRPARVEVRVV
jgi:SAM-dependent methyltransferase